MLKYILEKILLFVITLWVVITVSFILMKVAPGNPFEGERALSPAMLQNIMHEYNLDKPILWQYSHYLLNVIHGDFGQSYKMRDFTVTQLITIAAPVSIEITLLSVIIALLIGIVAGSYAALKQNSSADHGIMSVSMIGIVLPNFALAPILTFIFGVYLGILPVAGWDGIATKILPIIALALPRISYIARLTRGSMLEVLSSNYIRTAYAKGLATKTIIFRHALKPALMPVISYLGPTIATLMTGSVVIETIFDLPGLGRYIVQASLNRDYNVVLGITVFYAFLVLVLNFVSDILYVALDPRIKVSK
ncbi:ABC transporter permease [Rickettsiales bacterium LUAb2]